MRAGFVVLPLVGQFFITNFRQRQPPTRGGNYKSLSSFYHLFKVFKSAFAAIQAGFEKIKMLLRLRALQNKLIKEQLR